MIKSHRTKARLLAIEALEDRAVPSAMGVSARAASGASATIQVELTRVDDAINAAYSAFATTVFQDEVPSSTAGLVPPGFDVESPASLVTPIGRAIATLQTTLSSAVAGSVSTNALGLIESQITGSTPGSLVGGMGEILAAGAAEFPNGTLSPVSLNLIEAAIQGEVSSSYTAATVEAYLYASGQGSKAPTNVNLGQFTGRINVAYRSFDTTITQAESALYLYPTFGVSATPASGFTLVTTTPGGSTTIQAGTIPSASTNQPTPADEPQAIATAQDVIEVFDSQVGGLAQSLNSLVAGTSVASRAGAIQGQFVGAGTGLLGQLNSLLVASTSGDGAISVTNIGLLAASVDAAINASYTSTLVDGSLLASS